MHFSCVFAKKIVPLHTFLKKMETKNNKTGKSSPTNLAMKHGLELGVLFGLNFILNAQGASGSTWLSVLSWLLVIYLIYSVFRSALVYRMTECGGDITFRQSFAYIMWLFLFASIIAAVVRVLYLEWFDTTFLQEQLKQSIQVLDIFQERLHLSAADRAAAEESMKSMLRPVHFSLYYILYDLMMGLFAALILSPLVKKKLPIDNQE